MLLPMLSTMYHRPHLTGIQEQQLGQVLCIHPIADARVLIDHTQLACFCHHDFVPETLQHQAGPASVTADLDSNPQRLSLPNTRSSRAVAVAMHLSPTNSPTPFLSCTSEVLSPKSMPTYLCYPYSWSVPPVCT
jgi:hypothetical protein